MDLSHISKVPVIGRTLDTAGIDLVKKVLAQLEKGEALNIALVAEKENGDMIIAFSPGVGNPMKLAGATGILHRRVEDHVINRK